MTGEPDVACKGRHSGLHLSLSKSENPTMFLPPSVSSWLTSKLWAFGNNPGPQNLSRMVSSVFWSWLQICPGCRAHPLLHSEHHGGVMLGKYSPSCLLFSLGTMGVPLGLLHCSDHSSRNLWWDSFQSEAPGFRVLWILGASIIHGIPGIYLSPTIVIWHIGKLCFRELYLALGEYSVVQRRVWLTQGQTLSKWQSCNQNLTPLVSGTPAM